MGLESSFPLLISPLPLCCALLVDYNVLLIVSMSINIHISGLRISFHSDLSIQVDLLSECLSPDLQCAFEAALEQGTSCWLNTLPIAEFCFTQKGVS